MSNSFQEKKNRIAVFLMAHGAPESLDDIPQYLKNIRGGTESSPEVVQMIRDRYSAIGGSSPLLEITRSQAAALQGFLNQSGNRDFKVYFAMRNWSPYIRDVARVMLEDGVSQVLALCLAPQYSRWSTELYFNALRQAVEKNSTGVEIRFVTGWSNHPLLIDAYVERYQAAIKKLQAVSKENIYTVFTAHSIPSDSIAYGDPYAEEYTKTVEAIVERVKPYRWFRAYQSQGLIPVPWLGPTVEMVLDKIAGYGRKTVLIFPVGFVSDHIEILYDIDIGFKNHAVARNLYLSRTESLNLSPGFIEALASLVWEHSI
jgi:ferrochelatase